MPRHLTRAELEAGLSEILKSPKDNGRVEAIIVRPESEERRFIPRTRLTLAGGVEGDHWEYGSWKSTDEGRPHPNVQISIMNSRCINHIAGSHENWAPAGDNLFVDLDISPDNTPPGTRISLGSAILEVTETPHNGCAKFVERYGRDATVFVNTGEGKRLRLRGIYARVVKDGQVSVGDQINVL